MNVNNFKVLIDLLERSVNMQTHNLEKVLRALTGCTAIYCLADVVKTVIISFAR